MERREDQSHSQCPDICNTFLFVVCANTACAAWLSCVPCQLKHGSCRLAVAHVMCGMPTAHMSRSLVMELLDRERDILASDSPGNDIGRSGVAVPDEEAASDKHCCGNAIHELLTWTNF